MGHVDALQPDDESPFALGNLRSGEARLAVDANLFRAAAEPHAPAGAPLGEKPSTVGACAVYGMLCRRGCASAGLATDNLTSYGLGR